MIELDAYKLKMSQYDPLSDTYRKKPLKERWHRWGGTDILVQRDVMSAYLACYATKNGHDRALLLKKWPTVEALLRGSGYVKQQKNLVTIERSREPPRNSRSRRETERERGLP